WLIHKCLCKRPFSFSPVFEASAWCFLLCSPRRVAVFLISVLRCCCCCCCLRSLLAVDVTLRLVFFSSFASLVVAGAAACHLPSAAFAIALRLFLWGFHGE